MKTYDKIQKVDHTVINNYNKEQNQQIIITDDEQNNDDVSENEGGKVKRTDITDARCVDNFENAGSKGYKHKSKGSTYTPAYKKMLREVDLKEYRNKTKRMLLSTDFDDDDWEQLTAPVEKFSEEALKKHKWAEHFWLFFCKTYSSKGVVPWPINTISIVAFIRWLEKNSGLHFSSIRVRHIVVMINDVV